MTEDTIKMTHNEMIDVLKGLVFGTFDRTTAKEREALDMAIQTLEQEPCEDAISRKEAIKSIREQFSYGECYCDEYSIVGLMNNLPPVCQEPKWIPVSERLPEDKQSVLVWCPQYKNIYCSYREKEQWWIFGAFVQIVPNEVIAWMPLPEPYKESEG